MTDIDDSEAGFSAYSENAIDGSFRYKGALGAGTIILGFFLGEGERPVSLKTEAPSAQNGSVISTGLAQLILGMLGNPDRHQDFFKRVGGAVRASQDVALAALGLDMGGDIARGPEDTFVHVQFGHAWSLRMD